MKRGVVVLAGMMAGLAVWLVADPVLGIDLVVGEQTVGPVEVGLVAALAGLAGWGVVVLLERTVRRARTGWFVAASLVLLASLFGPLGGATAAAVAALAAMHLAVGAVLIPQLAPAPAPAAAPTPTADSART